MNMMTPIAPADGLPSGLAAPGPQRWPLWKKGGLVVVPVLVAGAGVLLMGKSEAPKAAAPAPVVTVAAPLVRAISEWDDFTGRFEPTETVEIRPRVSGQIVGVHFSDGQSVSRGQLLFTIDPRPFAAALAEARAGLASARSDLALAQTDLSRAERLLGDDAIAMSEVDRLRARVLAGSAAVAAGQARVRARALDLEFTRVRAPISGRVSDKRIDRGNLVGAGDGMTGTLLTTVNALSPIHFSFDASEALFLKAKRAQPDAEAPSVEVRLQDETDYRWRGRLDFTDNGLNPRSGTIRVRAVIDNPDGFLTAGMYGSARLSTGSTVNALLVPAAAVQVDQARKVVLVVGRDGSVAARPVTTGALIGGLRVVRSGLSPRDRVVIAGIQMARPGSKVQVRTGRVSVGNAPPAPAITTPAAGQATFAAR
jgi:membrane fusion protein, multidrug efflux system